ncbi:MAG: hypothetical protein VXY71_06540, partial [Pseudomonadota bacterium]|nr:hypothetical protein [Pseudomonadota bacterium]
MDHDLSETVFVWRPSLHTVEVGTEINNKQAGASDMDYASTTPLINTAVEANCLTVEFNRPDAL